MLDVTRTSRSLYRFCSRDELEQSVIERCRGTIVGYFAPTGFAGATKEALGSIVLPAVAAHERYRDMLDNDPEHKANVVRLAKSGAQVCTWAGVLTVALRGMNDSVVVKVKPGSHKGPLVEVGPNGELTIYVREQAVDGKANDAVTRLLAAHLQLPRSRVELISGTTSRLKRFRVSR